LMKMNAERNLTSPAVVASLLRHHGLKPKKRLGQSFLVDRNVLDKIVAAAELGPNDCVVEIGAGLGTVTRELASRAGRVVAVEADRGLIPVLRDTLSGLGNVEVVEADFLELALDGFLAERLGEERCVVVANLPYYITTPIVSRLIETKSRIRLAALMVQKEVAQRLIAPSGGDDYGAITVFVRYHCEVEIVAQVSRNVFLPPPEVDSALVRLRVRERPPVQTRDEGAFFAVVKAAFGQRRKTVLNALSGSPELSLTKKRALGMLQAAGIDAVRRGETLDLAEFARLADALGVEG